MTTQTHLPPILDCWAVVDLGGEMCLTGELSPSYLQACTAPVVSAERIDDFIVVRTANDESYSLGDPSKLFLARYPTGAQRIYNLVGKETT